MAERLEFPKPQTAGQCAALVLALALVAVLAGCQKKADATAELEKTVKALAQPSPGQPAAAQPGAGGPAVPSVSQQVNEAMNSFKAGNYSDAIGLMEKARTNPTRTPAQTMAVQDAMAAVMRDLYARAAQGDAVAQKAIKQYQENRTRH